MSRAAALGYEPDTTYAAAMTETCRSIEMQVQAGGKPPPYIQAHFDYAAEDAWLAERGM